MALNSYPVPLKAVVRPLRSSPTVTFAMVACLALGIGSTTAVYSVMHAVLLGKLPFASPDRLVLVWSLYPGAGGEPTEFFTTTENLLRFDRAESLDAVAGVLDLDVDILTDGAEPEHLSGAEASGSVFSVTGTRPLVGRVFGPSDAEPGLDRVAVIREDLWQRRFAGAKDVVGREIVVDGIPRSIIGVVPMRSAFPLRSVIWIPLVPDTMDQDRRERGMLTVLARIAEGRSPEAVQEDLDRLAATLREEEPTRNRDLGLRADPLHASLVEESRSGVIALIVGVGLLLVIACANVANLSLVRIDRQRHDMAVRLSLGATRRSVALRSLGESVVIALAGGGAGVLLAYVTLGTLVGLAPENTYGLDKAGLDAPVLAFALVVSLLTVLAFGPAPALLASRVSLNQVLTAGDSRTGSGSSKLQSRFVVAQAGIGVLLLAAAGMAAESLRELEAVDPGFDAGSTLTFRVAAPSGRYPTPTERVEFFRRLLEHVRLAPGVATAGGAHVLPIGDVAWGFAHSVESRPPDDPGAQNVSFLRVVTPGYFEAVGTRILEGRAFTDRDDLDFPPVAIVSRQLARLYWPNDSALGKRIKHRAYDSPNPWITIVGVADDVRDGGLGEEPSRTVYLPFWQQDRRYTEFLSVVVRARGTAVALGDVTQRVHEVDPQAALFAVRTLDDVVSGSLGPQRFSSTLLAAFSLLGLLLTAVGVYGVTEYAAVRRRREMAIRLALGATEGRVAFLLIRRGLSLAAGGVVLGLAGAYVLQRWVRTELLPADQGLDPVVLLAAAGLVEFVALAACAWPSWKMTVVRPASMLRGD